MNPRFWGKEEALLRSELPLSPRPPIFRGTAQGFQRAQHNCFETRSKQSSTVLPDEAVAPYLRTCGIYLHNGVRKLVFTLWKKHQLSHAFFYGNQTGVAGHNILIKKKARGVAGAPAERVERNEVRA